MKAFFTWFLKDVLLPLAPVICGTIVRFVNSGEIEFEITELSFSMAILFMFQLKSIGKKATTSTDKPLIDGLISGAMIAIIICLLIFILSVLYKLQAEKSLKDYIESIIENINNNAQLIDLKKIAKNYGQIKSLDQSVRLKYCMYILTIVSIPVAALFKFYYKLED
ncbi:hypothetical protein [Spirosoma foliorum]|uniref:DUF4199 domain-containing protein n=1 Tax=Spirosoma foliorum TaxID=2710596 RepID=A0A7G5H5G8_9BACT|nr:hypothetical protein [Spirosoma foliorum]QMW06360.1 hypothetical protein H3H32_16450 [Spirosoma foliorum]